MQPTISLLTTKTKYRAEAMAAQESTWLMQLMKDLHQEINYSSSLYCTNLFAIYYWQKNPMFHTRTKHVKVHYHFIREKVLNGEIELKPIKTEE